MPDSLTVAPAAPSTPHDLAAQIVALAANKDLDVQKLQALIDMQRQMSAANAEAAFNAAFCDMQAELPTVGKTSQGDGGKWAYAPLDAIVDAVRPVLARHGFSLSHRVEWPDPKTMKVVGILAHRLGHKRESEFQSMADISGSKNAIQGLGSANSYGRRYTSLDLLGLATSDADDDGHTVARPAPPPAPNGFANWVRDLETTAALGEDALRGVWFKSDAAFRKHMTAHHGAQWVALKKTAATMNAHTAAKPKAGTK